MYLPKSKYKGDQYTSGQEYIIPGEIDAYVGPYFTTFNGTAYTGEKPSSTSVKLEPLPEKENPTGYNSPITGEVLFYEEYDGLRNNIDEFKLRSTLPVTRHYPKPTQEDYNRGEFMRYFARDKKTRIVLEISKDVYASMKQKEPKYYFPKYDILEMKWNLTDAQTNISTIRFKSFDMPELISFINDPAQFVK